MQSSNVPNDPICKHSFCYAWRSLRPSAFPYGSRMCRHYSLLRLLLPLLLLPFSVSFIFYYVRNFCNSLQIMLLSQVIVMETYITLFESAVRYSYSPICFAKIVCIWATFGPHEQWLLPFRVSSIIVHVLQVKLLIVKQMS